MARMSVCLREGARLVLAAAASALWVVPLGAQTLGALRGLVLDDRGSPIPGATVVVSRAGQEGPGRGTVTDRTGAFQSTPVIRGRYWRPCHVVASGCCLAQATQGSACPKLV